MPKETRGVLREHGVRHQPTRHANDRISVVARYHDRDLLRGGWLDGEKYLAVCPRCST
jgi:hypothetical protein